jgi:hypothetical protein
MFPISADNVLKSSSLALQPIFHIYLIFEEAIWGNDVQLIGPYVTEKILFIIQHN